MDFEDIKYVNEKLIDYPATVRDLLDHLMLLQWFDYMRHRCSSVPNKNVNFDGREFIDLPSGKKVRITLIVEDITEEVKNKKLKEVEKNGNKK